MTEIRCHPGMGAPLKARALVASDGFSARYDLDRLKGTFSRPTHKLYGENYVGRILVLDQAKGGVATAWMFHEMQARGMAPAALLLNHANPVMAQGAAFGGIVLMDRFEGDITSLIANHTMLELLPEEGIVRILEE
ncbi:MAG: DUF126 domain-containing protein [Geminicoccaceae bacterium]|nr:DUF126 domain-containing protein [Geminicoccaceae bacterium]